MIMKARTRQQTQESAESDDTFSREDAEKYMSLVEQQADEEYESSRPGKKSPAKKRRIRPVPLTSKIPLYDKLMAEKEER